MTVATHVAGFSHARRRERSAQVRTLIDSARQALLTVRDKQGVLRTVLVSACSTESKNLVSFACDMETAEQVAGSPAVMLTYMDREAGRWLVVNGIGRVCRMSLPVWCRGTVSWLAGSGPRPNVGIEVRPIAAELWE